jgi:predicted  nucleic acid-binding Zn-ribbon protein
LKIIITHLNLISSFNFFDRENGNGTNIENSVKLHLRLGKRSSNNTKSSEFTTTTTTIPYDLGAITQSIQSIARAAAPIGRVMDYLPTEINAMVKERESWRDEYERQSNEFVREKKKTEVELEPVHAQVKAAEDEIEHMKELILKKKAQIGQNEKWIESHMKRITMLLPK